MALVGYSDSEGSDNESPNVAPIPAKAPLRKGAFQKLVDPVAPRKIKVDLPTTKPDVDAEAPPAKKPRTGGAFGGFNSFLPAPKRSADAAKKPGLGSGVNLKTGAEPAFSRERVEPDPPATTFTEHDDTVESAGASDIPLPPPFKDEAPKEVKPVGSAMKFKPLSVARKKTQKKMVRPNMTQDAPSPVAPSSTDQPKQAPPKPKVSLFSVRHDEDAPSSSVPSGDYQPFLAAEQPASETPEYSAPMDAPVHADTNSLTAIADDLGLSAGARRQLFGRNKDAAATANILHLNMEDEYNRNEELRAQGQATEHRAIKAVAPGKHSLQQLVNVATSQKEAMEDKWAEGKRNKGEAGSKYGF